MADPDLPSLRLPSAERREEVVARLSAAFAAGRLELEDLEQRLDVAMRAQTLAELDATLEGLERQPASASVVAPGPNKGEFAVDHPRRRGTALTFAFMSGVDRKGRWTPARRHLSVALMGGAFLDFREAVLQPGVTHVHCFTMWGGIEVAVPEGIDVEVSGLAIMGGLERAEQQTESTDPRRPVLHIHAFALMAGIEVKILKPGEDFNPKKQRRDSSDEGDEQ